jgi:hypothetical protein
VADHEQENAREHLTEREREALKILAREIVSAPGSRNNIARVASGDQAARSSIHPSA